MPKPDTVTSYADIGGWFTWIDRLLFDTILNVQGEARGALCELGAYLGRSAVIIGDHWREDERFVIVDLFGSEVGLADDHNRRENAYSYKTLTQEAFENNYRALHERMPEVVQGLSSDVTKHLGPGTARFIHIDASHIYAMVAEDIVNARTLLQPNGVVVLDDFRSAHTPGVAAATWEAVRETGLRPIVITSHKLYGTWGDPEPYIQAVIDAAKAHRRLATDRQRVHDCDFVRVHAPKRKAPSPAPVTDPAAPEKLSTPVGRGRALARELAPPALVRLVRKRRARSR